MISISAYGSRDSRSAPGSRDYAQGTLQPGCRSVSVAAVISLSAYGSRDSLVTGFTDLWQAVRAQIIARGRLRSIAVAERHYGFANWAFKMTAIGGSYWRMAAVISLRSYGSRDFAQGVYQPRFRAVHMAAAISLRACGSRDFEQCVWQR
jgi:hypothetical protein